MGNRAMHAGLIAAAGMLLAGGGVVAIAAPQPTAITVEQQRLIAAKRQSAAAEARSASLERAAAGEQDAAAKARSQEAAVAARIQQAEADIAAAQARIALVQGQLDAQRRRLAIQQGPIVRLLAALQSIARRPTVISLVQPGSVDDLVHVRAVLGTVTPVVQARTAGIRADLARTRALKASAAVAVASLGDSRTRLDSERLALARLEALHQSRSLALSHDALVASDQAIALGENARDIVDLMDQLGNQAATRLELETLSGPTPRPLRPGEVASSIDTTLWSPSTAPYRLPVAGRVVTGLGEVSDAGVRARGLTFVTTPGATVIAPAAGRVAYARRFLDYGTIVIIDHGGGWTTLVTHLARASVRVGETVAQGSPIGQAGGDNDPQVTVELRRKDRPIDMTPLLG